MRWVTDYGGTDLPADADEDVELLNKLVAALPDKAYEYYDDGNFDVYGPRPGEKTYYGGEYGKKMTVSFNR